LAKSDQRKRQRAGFEFFAVKAFKPRLVAWLVGEGLLDAGNITHTRITEALETYLRAQYELAYLPDDGTVPAPMGLLEREGRYEWRDPPTTFLITRRTAAIRRVADNIPEPTEYFDIDMRAADPPEEPDYGPETEPEPDPEEESADLSDSDIEKQFDEEGYEV
jgi:hypothetical protein